MAQDRKDDGVLLVVQAAERYEFVRTLTPRRFAELYQENLRGKLSFDQIIDRERQNTEFYRPGSAMCVHGYEAGKDCHVCYERWRAKQQDVAVVGAEAFTAAETQKKEPWQTSSR